MKKVFYLLAVALLATPFQSCSNDANDEEKPTDNLEKNYLSIENAVYSNENFPTATTTESLDGLEMSSQVMNGAMNYVTFITEKKVRKFFVGIKDIPGYWTYEPTNSRNADQGYNTYVIPVMISQDYNGKATMVLSGELDNGDVTTPVEHELNSIDTKSGAIEIKLAFSNSKDIDLHLFTPSGEHIYYGNRGEAYLDENGDTIISYGLDIDSNAGCDLDNINKENIYIPEELVDTGTYRVVVDMYRNCQPSIQTSWSIVARYKGELITPQTGINPASGVYPEGAGNGDMTEVMTFTITNSRKASHKAKIRPNTRISIPLSDMDRLKIEESSLR